MRHEIVCRRFSKLNVKHLYVCCKAKLAILVMTWVSLHLFCSLLNKKQLRKTFEEYKNAKTSSSGDTDEDSLPD